MSQNNLNSLLGGAGLDPTATSQMLLTADTLGPAINAGLGDVTLDDVETDEVVLLWQEIDDSGSIRFGSNAQHVRDGHNAVIDALATAKQSASVLAGAGLFNRGTVYPYRSLDKVDKFTTKNYDPSGGTPMYERVDIALTTMAAKMAEFEQGGISVRGVFFVISDGAGYATNGHDENTTFKMVRGLLSTEQFIIGGMGIDDGSTDFRQVYKDMGIPDEWILTPGDTASEIRRAFAMISQSAVRVSQASAASFSATAMGGFGTP